MEADLVLMDEWAAKFNLFASQQACNVCSVGTLSFAVLSQGGLDLHYLAARYEKGKRAVAELMGNRHTCSAYKQLTLAHGDVVTKQQEMGRSTFPGSLGKQTNIGCSIRLGCLTWLIVKP